ncbi:hypothetical protein OHA59_47645 [Streptomyces sp. NBC_01589]|uniref:hypothetical protein n=1 Tax=Streptomyces sp. NBC_01589 TaxID=2975886 RepID=UPI003869C812
MSNGASATPIGRQPNMMARICTVVVVLFAVWAALGVSTPAGAADGNRLVKVFAVSDPARTGGQPDTLPSIASRTLGDPDRAGEIFDLNRGQAQRDGGALTAPTEQLHPGWILRLPEDATGPDVQVARETAGQNASSQPSEALAGGATVGSNSAATGRTAVFTVPLPAAVAVLGAIVLAVVTAGIVGRRWLRGALTTVAHALRALGDPARRRRQLAERRALGQRFAADTDSLRRVFDTLEEFACVDGQSEAAVHAVRVDQAGATVWLAPSDIAGSRWTNVDSTRWRGPAGAGNSARRGVDVHSTVARRIEPVEACPVRVGTDSDGEPVFVDLSRLDGVLGISGDRTVARDVVQNLLAEIGRCRPNTPVEVLRGPEGAPPLAVPHQLTQAALAVPEIDGVHTPAVDEDTVRGGASRRTVKGLVIMAAPPTEREVAELAALCGSRGAGWTGLVCGEVDGAHWRWYADGHGSVDIPVLGLKLTVPA